MNIVGIVGFIGSGKGAAGDILVENGFVKESFAKGVKDTASVMFGWKRHLLEGDTEESRTFREEPDLFWSQRFGRDFTPREVLQKLGTEVGRDVFHEDFWVLQLEHRVKNYTKPVVITDVRFPNEIDWIHKMGGKVYEIQRGTLPLWYRSLKATSPVRDDDIRRRIMVGNNTHYSEWAWVGCPIDGTIDNNNSLEALTNSIKRDILCTD